MISRFIVMVFRRNVSKICPVVLQWTINAFPGGEIYAVFCLRRTRVCIRQILETLNQMIKQSYMLEVLSK